MTDSEIVLGLPQYEITAIERCGGTITISARYTGPISCPQCGGTRLRNKGWCHRTVRHDDWGFRRGILKLQVRKCYCLDCGRYFRQRLPGVQPCDLQNHRIYDVTLGRSQDALEAYFLRLEGKPQVRIVCMDLAAVYRSIVKKHFPQALIVADRFHVIRLVNHHFLACWREVLAIVKV